MIKVIEQTELKKFGKSQNNIYSSFDLDCFDCNPITCSSSDSFISEKGWLVQHDPIDGICPLLVEEENE